MKAFISIKYHENMKNRETLNKILDTLRKNGIKPICVVCAVDEHSKVKVHPSDLMKKTFNLIKSCDLIVVELSEKGIGIGIEAGYAYALGIPVFTVVPELIDLNTTIEGISQQIITYNSLSDLDKLASIIKDNLFFKKKQLKNNAGII